ncbi:MAG TPA: VWA domain-containing protein [Polyangia bacterium]
MSDGRRNLRPLLGIGLTILAAAVIAAALHLLVLRGHDVLATRVHGRDLELLQPRWLLLLAVLPGLWLVRTASLADLSPAQQVLSTAVRTVLAGGLILALARPALTRFETRVSAVYLVDVSDSISAAQLAAAHAEVSGALAARGDNDVRIITFARRPRLVEPPAAGPLPPFARHAGGGDATDLSAALRLAYGLHADHRLKRVVVLSDGAETDGDLIAESQRAARAGVRLLYRSFPAAAVKEVAVASLAVPDKVTIGQPFTVTAEVYSSFATSATLTLHQDEGLNGLEPRRVVPLAPGRNLVPFRSVVREPGFVTYRVQASDLSEDTFKDNNQALATISVRGKPRVLYIEGETSSAQYLSRALSSQGIDVEVRGPHGLPGSAKDLDRYDLVLMSDVPSTFVGLGQMAAIESYVRDLGGGFIMTGGEGSFGSGGYSGSRLEKVLPVRFDSEKRREEPGLALALVIDRSGSMTGPKIELAKEAARATAEMLGRADLIGVVAFDAQAQVIVRLQRAVNRARILGDIQRIVAGGGTAFIPPLREAFDMLRGAHAKVKHVILLSDGQARYEGIGEMCDEMLRGGITISTVGVGQGADKTLLRMMASRGGGRFYFTEEAENIPRLFTKETTEVARSALVEQPVRAVVAKRVEMIEGTGVEEAPALHGYVSTKPKPMSETILVAGGEPLLSRWRLGLGQAAVFTSDVKNRWAVQWLRWAGYPRFWAQVVRSVMRHRITEAFEMRTEVSGGRAHITVDAVNRNDRFVNGLETTVQLIDPRRPAHPRELPLTQTAAGRYETELPLDRYGAYALRAVHRIDGKAVAESAGTLALSYPPEYRWGTADGRVLARAAALTGGAEALGPAAVFDARGERIPFHGDLWPWVISACAALFLVDVLLRRVRLGRHVVR